MTQPKIIQEALEYRDLAGMIKPTVHIDEFASKMGSDDEIVVVSFYVRDGQAARDLMNWFEKGYDFVLDADRSPGEIRPNRYLVYVELRRRSNVGDHVQTLLDDLQTLCEYEPSDWTMDYQRKQMPWSLDTFNKLVPRTPREYREQQDQELNEVRIAAGIAPHPIYQRDALTASIQHAAGI